MRSIRRTFVFLVILVTVSGFPISTRFLYGEVWFEDFTDGDISDDSGIEWSFLQNHEMRDDGLVIRTPSSGSPAAIMTYQQVPRSQSWSIRVEGIMLQDDGFFGPGITPGPDAGGSVYSLIDTDGDVEFGFAGVSTEGKGIGLSKANENSVVQFDTLPNFATLWAWPGDDLPTTEVAPHAFGEMVMVSGYPAVWTRSNAGPSSLLIKNITISTEHIAIGDRPIPCDFNQTRTCDISDLDLLFDAFESSESEFDLDGNGTVDTFDRDSWLELAGLENIGQTYLLGDTNLDGNVKASDLNDLALNWQSTTATSYAQGDINGDGRVNASDLNDLALNWQATAATAPVPEPDSVLPLLGTLAAMVAIRRRRTQGSVFATNTIRT